MVLYNILVRWAFAQLLWRVLTLNTDKGEVCRLNLGWEQVGQVTVPVGKATSLVKEIKMLHSSHVLTDPHHCFKKIKKL